MATGKRTKAYAREKGDTQKVVYYQCKWASPSRAINHTVCFARHFQGTKLEPQVINVLLEVMDNPVLLQAAFGNYRQQLRKTFHEDEFQRVQRQLAELDKREKATAKAQIEALIKEINTEVYDQILRELKTQKEELQASLVHMESNRLTDHQFSELESKGEFMRRALTEAREVLTASDEEVAPADKQRILSRVIEAIYPLPDTSEAMKKKAIDYTRLRIIFRPFETSPRVRRWVWESGKLSIAEKNPGPPLRAIKAQKGAPEDPINQLL